MRTMLFLTGLSALANHCFQALGTFKARLFGK